MPAPVAPEVLVAREISVNSERLELAGKLKGPFEDGLFLAGLAS